MSLVLSNLKRIASGNQVTIIADAAFDSAYVTGGEPFTAISLGLSRIDRVRVDGQKSGYLFDGPISTDTLSARLMVYAGTGGGTAAAQTFTGATPSSDLNLATPRFTGTGLTAAGQVITTTDNQTMLLNECAGMWLIPATGATPPVLILSNTAVTGAPAVLTVQGAAATDAGAYKIVTSANSAGSNAASAVTGGGGTATEIPNGTDLSTLTGVQIEVVGV
jgi:hypothetical protein